MVTVNLCAKNAAEIAYRFFHSVDLPIIIKEINSYNISSFSCGIAYTSDLPFSGENSLHGCINDFMSISCSEGPECQIQIRRAIYWHRPDASNCTVISDACASNASDVWNRCQEKPSCDFYVRQQRPSGVCLRSESFALTVEYSCNCSSEYRPLY